MPPKTGTTPDWQDLEKQAYHACREWPLWLMLRTRALEARLRKETSKSHPAAAPRSGTNPVQKRGS
ncbi:MAG: hypothetical protein ABI700_14330 [Chloroflexota bacterium]